MKNLSIKELKKIREMLDASSMVIFAQDKKGIEYIGTHGRTKKMDPNT